MKNLQNPWKLQWQLKYFNTHFKNIVYSQYLGDGDTLSFKKVVESNPYSSLALYLKKLNV